MAVFNGIKLSKKDLLQYIGSMDQLAGVKEYRFSSGKADGAKGLDIRSGSGLNFTVLPDRGMDISNAEFMDCPLAWISKNKIVSSKYFETEDLSFLRNFFGGLITTCGLTHVGQPCDDDGERLGLHGRISNTPAEKYNILEYWQDDDYIIEIIGHVRQTRLYGENVLLIRSIKCTMGEPKISIQDQVINEGYEDIPLMILYHCNFGFPLVSKESRVYTTAKSILPENKEAKGKDFSVIDVPTPRYKYELYKHVIDSAKKKNCAAVINDNLGLGAYVLFDSDNLTNFYQWKMLAQQDYVVALEPSNCIQEGRANAKKNNRSNLLKPGEKKCFNLEIGVLKNKEKINNFLDSL